MVMSWFGGSMAHGLPRGGMLYSRTQPFVFFIFYLLKAKGRSGRSSSRASAPCLFTQGLVFA